MEEVRLSGRITLGTETFTFFPPWSQVMLLSLVLLFHCHTESTFLFFFFCILTACGMVPQPGIEPGPPQ